MLGIVSSVEDGRTEGKPVTFFVLMEAFRN